MEEEGFVETERGEGRERPDGRRGEGRRGGVRPAGRGGKERRGDGGDKEMVNPHLDTAVFARFSARR